MSYTRKQIFAPLPQTARGQPVHIGGDPKGKNFLYTNGKSVFIRNIENPSIATEYTQHIQQTTVARYSPTGYYIASGDITGNVRIWDTVGDEQILKSEIKVVAGRINDIAWDGDSQRVIAVGDGKERFGHAFAFDTLNSAGEVIGHSKPINAVSIRHQRPFRAATAADDSTVIFYTGVPFKFSKVIKDHARFVQGVEFAPDGGIFASVGADGKIFLYDGKTGDKLHELVSDQGHTGGIFSVAWSPDGSRLLTSSADSTAKIWDVQAQSIVSTFDFTSAGSSFETQQVGNLWQGDYLLSLGLSGDISYLDAAGGGIARTIKGHQKAITALTLAGPTASRTFFTGSYDGRVYAWHYGRDDERAAAVPLGGAGHANQVTSIVVQGDALLSAGMDDVVRIGSVEGVAYGSNALPTGSQPRSVAVADDGTFVVLTLENVQVYDKSHHKLATLTNLGYTPTAVAISPDRSIVIVGGEDSQPHAYKLTPSTGDLSPLTIPIAPTRGAVSALAISRSTPPLLAAGDAQGKIQVYDLTTGATIISQWVFHSGRISSLAWSDDGKFAVSGGLDTNVFVWSVDRPGKKVQIKNAHSAGVNGVGFVSENKVVSVGQDATVKVWEVVLP